MSREAVGVPTFLAGLALAIGTGAQPDTAGILLQGSTSLALLATGARLLR